MALAGGISSALFHRERTGEATVVDVSLLGTGMWAMGQAIALSLLLEKPWTVAPQDQLSANPLVGTYLTKDGRGVALTCLQAGAYWAPLCKVLGRPDLAVDPRFVTHESLLQNAGDAVVFLTGAFAEATVDEWRRRLDAFVGQWAIVQDTLEAAADPQSVANGYLQECQTAGGVPFRLVAAPVQFDEEPAVPRRAPEFNEHADEILSELGLDQDAVLDLRIRGVVS